MILTTILSSLPLIGKFFEFGNNVTNAIRDLQLSKVNAKSEKEKAEIQERIDQLNAIASLQSVEATATSRVNSLGRLIMFGVPASVAFWKFVVYDNVIGAFVGCNFKGAHLVDGCKTFGTPDFSPNVWYIIMMVCGFYLLHTRK